MKALSLTRPWCWIIEHLGKRIENRTWNTDYRGPVLLHSSKTMRMQDWCSAQEFVLDRFDIDTASRIPSAKDSKLVKSAIVLVADLVAVVYPGWKLSPTSQFLAPSRFWEAQKKWYMGEFAFVLRHVAPTHVVPCNGTHKLWTPSADIVNAALDGIKWPGNSLKEPPPL